MAKTVLDEFLFEEIASLNERIKELERINELHRQLNGELRKEKKEFTNKVKKAFEYMRNTNSFEWESGRAYDVAYEMIFDKKGE